MLVSLPRGFRVIQVPSQPALAVAVDRFYEDLGGNYELITTRARGLAPAALPSTSVNVSMCDRFRTVFQSCEGS